MVFPWFVLLVAMFSAVRGAPMEPASQVAANAGLTCERGCIVADDGFAYSVTRDDLVVAARAANCEVASVIGTEDADAAMWALVQNFVRRHRVGLNETLASFIAAYSGCTGKKWSSSGWARNARITPRADANRRLRWGEIPQSVRDYTRSFFAGEVPNRMPGAVYVLTHGWERHADPSWIGPYEAGTFGPGSRNAYWKDRSTFWWTVDTVRIAPATGTD